MAKKKKDSEQPEELTEGQSGNGQESISRSVSVSGLYEDWFLEYASYVIMERAVPHLLDGFKPVQRRILHALREMDDGRFHKVANAIGQTMQYHPHGDAAIGDALVNLGQKELLIDTQGNWGDVRTGDGAAAPRYIEARLSKFALAVAFNAKITEWQLSYDGRKREPVTLPVKFPLLLALGVEGIAVGLATKILPHNFQELCKACIKVLEGKPFKILPDFPTGGIADISDYQQGKRGGKVRVRASIDIVDKKTLAIRDIPFGTTTASLMDTIVKANEKGKIKIKKVVDNTAADVEILVELSADASPEVTLDALYAFTQCEVSISPNACVIYEDKPRFYGVDEILRINTEHTREVLRLELEIRRHELEEKWHFASLEKIFIENRIYRDIEECETWEAVIEAIDQGLEPFKPGLNREVTTEDIVRLTEIKIKRISKFDSFKADENLKRIEEELTEVRHHLANLTAFAIGWFEKLLAEYGAGRERKTRLQDFETIQAVAVAAANARLYVNRAEGFIGYGLKKDELIGECSDMDDIVIIRKDGVMSVTRIAEKKFVGKDILYVGVWKKNDDRTTYNMIYADVVGGRNYAKRFQVSSITRDKEYPLGASEKSKVLYLTANPNGESEIVQIQLAPGVRAHNKSFDFDFAELDVKGRSSRGNIISKYAIRKVTRLEVGSSTLGGRQIWLDDSVGRLNTEGRGQLLGEFDTGDLILLLHKDGMAEWTSYELSNRYDMNRIERVQKFEPQAIFSVVHQDGQSKVWYVKRFLFEKAGAGRQMSIINESPGSKLGLITDHPHPEIIYTVKSKTGVKTEYQLRLDEFIEPKGWKAQGNKLSSDPILGKIKLLNADQIAESPDEEKPYRSGQGRSGSPVDLLAEPDLFKDMKEAKSKSVAKGGVKGKTNDELKRKGTGFKAGDQVEWDLEKGTRKTQTPPSRIDEGKGDAKAAPKSGRSVGKAPSKTPAKTSAKPGAKASDKPVAKPPAKPGAKPPLNKPAKNMGKGSSKRPPKSRGGGTGTLF